MKALSWLDGIVRRHALIKVGATGGKNSDTTNDIAETFMFLIDGSPLGSGREIRVQLLGTTGEIDIHMRDVVLGAGISYKFILKVVKELLAGITHHVGRRCDARTDKVDIVIDATGFVVETYHRLVKTGILEVVPLNEAVGLSTRDLVCIVKVKASQGVARRCHSDRRLGDERTGTFLDERNGVSSGKKLTVDSIADVEDITVVLA